MKTLIFILFFLLQTHLSYAAKAVCVVVSTQSTSQSVEVQVSVSDDSGQNQFTTSFVINFLNSTNQMNSDIKQRVRDILVSFGVNITTNDVILFGGAQ